MRKHTSARAAAAAQFLSRRAPSSTGFLASGEDAPPPAARGESLLSSQGSVLTRRRRSTVVLPSWHIEQAWRQAVERHTKGTDERIEVGKRRSGAGRGGAGGLELFQRRSSVLFRDIGGQAVQNKASRCRRSSVAGKDQRCASTFTVLRTIKRGPSSTVQIVQMKTPTLVGTLAVKIVDKHLLSGAYECPSDVQREKKMRVQLAHPALAKLVDAWQDDRALYLCSELCGGGSLLLILKRRRRLPLDAVRFFVAQLTLGIEYLHVRKMVHRSLKTSGLSLDAAGNVKISSFSQLREVRQRRLGPHDDAHFNKFLDDHADCRYLAPELISAAPYDCAVDWWALGIVMYELLFGNPPFDAGSRSKCCTRAKIAEGTAPGSRQCVHSQILWTVPSLVDGSIDMWARDFLLRFLEKEPDSRLGSRGGSSAIKTHAFFARLSFQDLEAGKLRAPLQPNVFCASQSTNDMFPDLRAGRKCAPTFVPLSSVAR